MYDSYLQALRAAGLDQALFGSISTAPALTGDFAADAAACRPFWAALDDVQQRLVGRVGSPDAASLAARDYGCDTRAAFLDRHLDTLYRGVTNDYGTFVRVEQLVEDVADLVPGLVPTKAALAADHGRKLAEKVGVEVQQGVLLASVLADPQAGLHLCHAMMLPCPEAAEALARFRRDGAVDLGPARVERRGDAAVVVLSVPERLNCEDATTYVAMETAVDVVLLDPTVKIGLLRGDRVAHPKYAGRHLLGSGINLTGLYWGEVPYQFYISRDLGLVNKMYRGIARPDRDPSEIGGGTTEKLWVAVVEGFAIGGACQLLLVMDHNIAERGAYMTLPARKEGIIPGMANLRLARFVGDRLARQGILNDRRFECDSAEGRMICDEVVDPADIEATIDRTIGNLTSSGVVSAAGNRRALRMQVEPLDLFRQYAAVYAREQAYCHLSPALVANLERHWQAHERKAG